jgi:NarL family two-component system response regulator LiaR
MNTVISNPSPATTAPFFGNTGSWLEAGAKAARLRVFVADDHSIYRYGVMSVLSGERHMVLVGEAADGLEAVRAAPALEPDVVLMDLDMPRLDGVGAIQALRPLLPHARFVMVSCTLDAPAARRALAAGATSFLLKSSSPQELLTVIQAAHRGHRMMAPEVMDALALENETTTLGADLTQRERELIGLMARGMGNREIAERLLITMPTVKFHVTNILSKMHAANRTAAVLSALKNHTSCWTEAAPNGRLRGRERLPRALSLACGKAEAGPGSTWQKPAESAMRSTPAAASCAARYALALLPNSTRPP